MASSTASSPAGYPPNVQVIFAGQPDGDLDALARYADRIFEAAPQPAFASVVPLPDSAALIRHIKHLYRQVAAISAGRVRPSSRNSRPDSRSPSRDDAASTLCWYHRRYRALAQKCTQPYAYRQQGKLTQHTCATTTGRLFISGQDNVAADALSRVESVNAPPSYDALAASQDSDDELQTLLESTTALRLEKLPIPGTMVSIYCDTSAGRYVPASLRLQVFQSVHDLPHPGTKATAKLVAQRFVWPGVQKDFCT
jgi:hypothetical protein